MIELTLKLFYGTLWELDTLCAFLLLTLEFSIISQFYLLERIT